MALLEILTELRELTNQSVRQSGTSDKLESVSAKEQRKNKTEELVVARKNSSADF